MLIRPAPISNTERQRKFRRSHPGYYSRYKTHHPATVAALLAAARAQANESSLADPTTAAPIPTAPPPTATTPQMP